MKKLTLVGLAAAILSLGLTGCTQEAREKYDQAGDAMAKGTEKTGEAISTDAKATGEAIKDGAQEAGQAVENSGMTGQVRLALSNAHNLKIDDLNVDTIDKKIVLKGSVATEEDKKQAGDLAKATAGGDYTLDNQLVVGGTKQ